MNNKNDDTLDDLKIKVDLDIESKNKNILTKEKLSKEKIKVKKPIKAKSIKHLLLGVKNISIFRLYYTISTPFDLILISIAILMSLCSGCSRILLAMVYGDSTDSLIVGRFLEIFQKKISKEILQPIIDLIFYFLDPETDEKVKLYLIIGAIMFGSNFIMMFLWSYTATKQIHWMKADYFRLILNQEQGWFDKNNSYEFATKVQAQLKQIEIGIGDRCGQLIVMLAEILAGLIFAFISSWKLSLFFLTCLPFIASGGLLMSFCLNGVNLKSRKAYEFAGGIAEELLYNIKTVTTFVNFEYELQRYGHLIDEVEKIGKRKAIISGLSIGIIVFGIFIGYTCCLLYARKIICDHYDKYDSEANHIINDIADIIVNKDNTDTFYSSDTSNNKEIRDLLQPLKMIYANINNHEITIGTILKVISSLIGTIIAIGQIFPILQLIKEACVSSSDYFVLRERIPNFDTSGKNLTPERENIKGRIEFKDIKFIYPSDKNQRPILNGLNLSIEPGKKIAFVGESGCGKSTTVNLLERLYEPTEGHILLDGIDIKDFNLEYLRTLIGYVQQEPVLFNKSIKENLYFGRYDAVKNLGDPNKLMEEAARDADITEFIHKFPERFDYVVGVKGNKLSGGQKQRIAIARAILAKPKILILDEATSALDNKSEKEVQRSLDNISKRNVTTLIIAHRLSTIQNADVIYALKGGKVEEMGTHEELLQKKGYYYHLVESQCGEDQNKARVHKQIEAKKTTIGKLTKDYTKIITALQKYEKGEIGKSPEIKYKEIFNLISDHKCDLFLGTLAGFIYGVGTPLYGFLLAKVINSLAPRENIQEMKDDSLLWSLMHLVVSVVGGVSIMLKDWKLESLSAVITARMRKRIIRKYLELHIGFYDLDEHTPGSLLTKLSIDTTQLSALILPIFGSLFSTAGSLLLSITLSLCYDWRLALITLCFLPFNIFFTVYKGYFRQQGNSGNKNIEVEAGSILSECVTSTKTIYSFNFQKPAINLYKGILKKETSSVLGKALIAALFIALGAFVNYACYATIYKASIKFIKDQTLNFSDMNITINVLLTITGIAQNLLALADFPKAKDSFRSIYSILNTPSEINAFEEVNTGKITAENLKGKIEFKNVYFAYPTKPQTLILNNISFVIESGKSAALVGFSGCGKSTIIQLLERYYDPVSGQVLIDDIDIKEYNLFELRKKIGLVNQEPTLFKRSIYENILYGRLDANESEVFEVAQKAVITKFFKDGHMGDKDEPLSGGEKQRVAIARAFLKNPVILLLDEATSALDKESEVEVQKSLSLLQKGRTSVTIAHRLNTIIDSDIIFVLKSGKIIEKGTHKELIAKKGKYYSLYNSN